MSDDWDAEDRAIARALDAAPDNETGVADPSLVDEYREALAALPIVPVTPRADLEDRIVGAALQRRPAAVPSLERKRAGRYNRVRVAALAVATVAAAVVVGLIVHDNSSGSGAAGVRVALATQARTDVTSLVRSPGARVANLGAGNGQVVISASGRGAVYGIVGTEPVQIGLVSSGGTTTLGPTPPTAGIVAFTVDHADRVTTVTLERNGVEVARVALRPS